jgi:CheY-like chemotaxis protein
MSNQEVARAMLSKVGCQAEIARSGMEALDALAQADYDLVLMDCEMPGIDGFETTRRIRDGSASVRNPAVPIVALTANAMKGDRERCIAARMDDYLAKPIEPAALAEVLTKWTDRSARPDGRNEAIDAGAHESQDIFEKEALIARLSGDESVARKVVSGFLKDAPLQLLSLRALIERRDPAGVGAQAHQLKGAAATVSAPLISNCSHQVILAAKAGDLVKAAEALVALEAELDQFRSVVSGCGW